MLSKYFASTIITQPEVLQEECSSDMVGNFAVLQVRESVNGRLHAFGFQFLVFNFQFLDLTHDWSNKSWQASRARENLKLV